MTQSERRIVVLQCETFEHEADIGIRGFGSTMNEAFANAAAALFSVMVATETVEPKVRRMITVSAPDEELLLVEWLNALLSASDIDHMVFSRFEVDIKGTSLVGTAWGEILDQKRHEPKVEVKGATYHLLQVKKKDGLFTAQCVVDV
ncbi:MAG TPA: archease [Desulfomonilaceae bacterium]|nr:archease [Desulfomonilaceae bacterium]